MFHSLEQVIYQLRVFKQLPLCLLWRPAWHVCRRMPCAPAAGACQHSAPSHRAFPAPSVLLKTSSHQSLWHFRDYLSSLKESG